MSAGGLIAAGFGQSSVAAELDDELRTKVRTFNGGFVGGDIGIIVKGVEVGFEGGFGEFSFGVGFEAEDCLVNLAITRAGKRVRGGRGVLEGGFDGHEVHFTTNVSEVRSKGVSSFSCTVCRVATLVISHLSLVTSRFWEATWAVKRVVSSVLTADIWVATAARSETCWAARAL